MSNRVRYDPSSPPARRPPLVRPQASSERQDPRIGLARQDFSSSASVLNPNFERTLRSDPKGEPLISHRAPYWPLFALISHRLVHQHDLCWWIRNLSRKADLTHTLAWGHNGCGSASFRPRFGFAKSYFRLPPRVFPLCAFICRHFVCNLSEILLYTTRYAYSSNCRSRRPRIRAPISFGLRYGFR